MTSTTITWQKPFPSRIILAVFYIFLLINKWATPMHWVTCSFMMKSLVMLVCLETAPKTNNSDKKVTLKRELPSTVYSFTSLLWLCTWDLWTMSKENCQPNPLIDQTWAIPFSDEGHGIQSRAAGITTDVVSRIFPTEEAWCLCYECTEHVTFFVCLMSEQVHLWVFCFHQDPSEKTKLLWTQQYVHEEWPVYGSIYWLQTWTAVCWSEVRL